MPSLGQVLKEMQDCRVENPLDIIRRKYLRVMHKYTGRNVIAMYSGFLQKDATETSITDYDKIGLMQAAHGLDKSRGLDLLLHTPGGDVAATESIVYYLRSLFGNDVRAFVPQMAMSAGTMIALSCKEIIMGTHSCIGPIDPHFGGISCAGVIEEFEKAIQEVSANPDVTPLWQTIVSKYHPTFLGDCQKAIAWSEKIVKKWMIENMFSTDANKEELANRIVSSLTSHKETLSHSRHIHLDACRNLGIKVVDLDSLEEHKIGKCDGLRDCVLTIHHAFTHTFANSSAVKIIENHKGNRMIVNDPR